jgi:hypothetical protein
MKKLFFGIITHYAAINCDAVIQDMKISNRYMVLTVLAIATLFTYADSIRNSFTWDDVPLIVNNPAYKSVDNLPLLFKSSDTYFLGEQTPYYRPVNNVTFMLDYRLYGLKPLGYHAENIAFHCIAVLLLYALMNRLFFKKTLAFMSALLFAIHPINTEVINLIVSRNNILAAVFIFLSFITYLHGINEHKIRYLFLSGFFFFLGCLSKETALMLPLVLLLYDFKFSASLKDQIVAKIARLSPFVLFTALYFAMRAYALSGALGTGAVLGGAGKRILLNIAVVPEYLLHMVFPLNLSILYMVPEHLRANKIWLLCIWTALLLILFFLLKRKNPVFNFGLLWSAVNFIPVSNIVPIAGTPMADRFMYLPAVGFYIIAAECFYFFYAHVKWRRTAISSAVAVILVLSVLTIRRNLDWKDDISLFKSMVKIQPQNPEGHYNLGSAYLDTGDLSGAAEEWKKTIEINPGHEGALINLGNVYNLLNEPEKAKNYYQAALGSDSPNPVVHYNLARTLEKLGERDEALKHYEIFLRSVTPEFSYLIPKAKSNMEALKNVPSGTNRQRSVN